MGICASSQITRRGGIMKWPPTAIVIDMDGELQEYKKRIKAGHILNQNPNCFLCHSDAMLIGSRAPTLADDEELQLGQIYFLMPISKSKTPLSLQDLCALAIKASTALNNSVSRPFPAEPQACCKAPMAKMSFPAVVHGGRSIEYYGQQS